MADRKQKLIDLSAEDWDKLEAVKQYRGCPSLIDALRQCIRDTRRSDIDRLKKPIRPPLFVVAGNEDEFKEYLRSVRLPRVPQPEYVAFARQLTGYTLHAGDVKLFGSYRDRDDWPEIRFAIESATDPGGEGCRCSQYREEEKRGNT